MRPVGSRYPCLAEGGASGAVNRALKVYDGVLMRKRRGWYTPKSVGANAGKTSGGRCSILML